MSISKGCFYDVAIPLLAHKDRTEHIHTALHNSDWEAATAYMGLFDERTPRIKPLLTEDEYKRLERDSNRLRDALAEQNPRSSEFCAILGRTTLDLMLNKVVACECGKKE